MRVRTVSPPAVVKKVPSELLSFKPGVQGRRGVMGVITFESAFDALQTHRMRSFFTILGIVIGVAALIAVVTLTQSVNQAVNKRFADLGADVLTISPGTATHQGARGAVGSAQTLSLADAEAISQLPSIVNMSPIVSVSEQVVYENKNWNTKISGVYPSYSMIQDWQASQGSWFNEQDEQTGDAVAVVGQTVVANLFPNSDRSPIGQTIRINSTLFRIVGILDTKGGQGVSDADDVIFIPFSAASKRLNSMLHIQQIQVQIANINDLDAAQHDISSLLRVRHALAGPDPDAQQSANADQGSFLVNGGGNQQGAGGTKSSLSLSSTGAPDDFRILSLGQLVQSAQQSATQLTILLIGIAGISLAVGGVGIMNIMLVSVTERTREIGIRIAVGARRRDIRNQFLLEATMLSTFGGVIGIIIGMSCGLALVWWLKLPIIFSPLSPFIAFSISACIGIASGLYPATSAARLDPIIAIHQE